MHFTNTSLPQCAEFDGSGSGAAARGRDRARPRLLREAGYKNEPMVLLHAQASALLNPIGLVFSVQMRRADFNVDFRSTDYAIVAPKRLSRAPAEQGGWGVAPTC